MRNDFAPQKLRKQGKIILARNAERPCLSAECGTRNDFAPQKLRKQGKIILVRNAERPCLSAECGMRNAERLHSANAPLTRKIIFLSV